MEIIKLGILYFSLFTGCKAAETPIESNLKLQPARVEKVLDRDRFQRLIYLSHTSPNIAFAMSIVSQFMHSPRQHHFDVVYRNLRYQKRTPGKGLLFEDRGHLEVEVYTDVD